MCVWVCVSLSLSGVLDVLFGVMIIVLGGDVSVCVSV